MARRTKKFVLLLLIFTISLATAWLTYQHFVRKYRSGSFIQLVDLLPKTETAASRSPLNRRKETLDRSWIRIVELNKSTTLWRTSASYAIADSPSPKLFSNDKELIIQSDIFQVDTTSGRWTWSGDSIWITVPTDRKPSNNVRIEYQPDDRNRFISLTESLAKPQIYDLKHDSREIGFFQTRYPSFACKNGDEMSVRDGSSRIQRIAGLLSNPALPAGWDHLSPAHFILMEAGTKQPFGMYSGKSAYVNDRYYSTGLVRWTFLASGTFAGKSRPKLSIQVDDRRIAMIRIDNKKFQNYPVQTFLQEGFHKLRATFVNDYYDPELKTDRNILLARVDVEYLDAIVLASAPGQLSDNRYTVKYCTPEPSPAVARFIDRKGKVRESLLLGPSSLVDFHVRLSQPSSLTFGILPISDNLNGFASTHLRIVAKTFWGKTTEIFSYTTGKQVDWQEKTIDLAPLSDQLISLEFQTTSTAIPLKSSPQIAISNPILFSQQKAFTNPLPYIFIITADALRADHLSCYGYNRPTSPNIDRFAKDSVLFENAISQGAGTLPSTSSLFTSVYPSAHRTDYNTSRLPARFLTLPEIARARGYLTAGFVQNGFLNPPHGLSDGFARYEYDTFPSSSEARLLRVMKWMREIRGFPTFLFFHLLHPHSPYIPPPEIAKLFDVTPTPLSSSSQKLADIDAQKIILRDEERRELISLYDAEIRHLDVLFGELIQSMTQAGIYDDALIIFLSDHGEAFQEHGQMLHGTSVYQNMTHVPLLIKLPAKFRATGIRVREYVQTMDVMPTILELFGVNPPEFIEGKSLMPFMKTGTKDRNASRAVFTEVLSSNILGIIKDGFKYVYFGRSGEEELYNLSSDPQETHDLAAGRSDLIKRFRKERDGFFYRTSEWRKKYSVKEEHIALDESQTEQLRALGYIQ